MASIKFKKGLLQNLPSNITEGHAYLTTDELALYFDISATDRIRVGDFQQFATLEALTNNAHPLTSALYYVEDMNCLCKYDADTREYIQINLDTGMTDVEIVGSGNAVTAVSYNSTTRKLTLTKGETFVTSDKIGDIANQTVKEYVDTKAAVFTKVMHFRGVVASKEACTNPVAGDVIIVGTKEYVYGGEPATWFEIGDESMYTIAGSITDADIAADAAISMSKISGLGDALNAKATVANLDTAVDRLDTIQGTGNGSIAKALADAKTYANGLAGNYDASGAAATAETNAKNYSDNKLEQALSWGTF